jgi:hypothetical protein
MYNMLFIEIVGCANRFRGLVAFYSIAKEISKRMSYGEDLRARERERDGDLFQFPPLLVLSSRRWISNSNPDAASDPQTFKGGEDSEKICELRIKQLTFFPFLSLTLSLSHSL